MELEKIVTLANAKSAIQFRAMERSLRATGCNLPVWVIPYNNDLFDLPEGSLWWKDSTIIDWLGKYSCHPTTRKYQCLTISNYQFVDTDVCFLRNPQTVLEPFVGFITSCTEWNKSFFTYPTNESRRMMYAKSSTWQKSMFSAGQFASDRILYSTEELIESATHPRRINSCLEEEFEQVGLNLLVADAGVPVTNLTLPPTNMESTWAGDYPHEYEQLWQHETSKPYLIHWAGPALDWSLPINQIFYDFLTTSELNEWKNQDREKVWQHREKQSVLTFMHRGLRYLLRKVENFEEKRSK